MKNFNFGPMIPSMMVSSSLPFFLIEALGGWKPGSDTYTTLTSDKVMGIMAAMGFAFLIAIFTFLVHWLVHGRTCDKTQMTTDLKKAGVVSGVGLIAAFGCLYGVGNLVTNAFMHSKASRVLAQTLGLSTLYFIAIFLTHTILSIDTFWPCDY